MTSDALALIAEYVMPELALGRADIGLLFGTRHGVEEFCVAAYALWERQMFGKLVISGGSTLGVQEPEASVIANRLLRMGMPTENPDTRDCRDQYGRKCHLRAHTAR